MIYVSSCLHFLGRVYNIYQPLQAQRTLQEGTPTGEISQVFRLYGSLQTQCSQAIDINTFLMS